MKKFSSLALIALIFMIFIMASCGEVEKNEKDDEGKTDVEQNDDAADEEEIVDDTETVDDVVELAYPENITSTSKKEGDIARNLEFYDEKDNQRFLAEWYKENNEESKLIWIIFSTYDCPACQTEKSDIPILNGKHASNGLKTILIMNGLLAGPRVNEEPEKIALLQEVMVSMEGKSADHVYGYLKKQTDFRAFINAGYPVNVFIDASTMEIVRHEEGWGADDSFFNDIDNFLETMLDML